MYIAVLFICTRVQKLPTRSYIENFMLVIQLNCSRPHNCETVCDVSYVLIVSTCLTWNKPEGQNILHVCSSRTFEGFAYMGLRCFQKFLTQSASYLEGEILGTTKLKARGLRVREIPQLANVCCTRTRVSMLSTRIKVIMVVLKGEKRQMDDKSSLAILSSQISSGFSERPRFKMQGEGAGIVLHTGITSRRRQRQVNR